MATVATSCSAAAQNSSTAVAVERGRAALLARLAATRPEDLVRLMAFRETFLARLTPERLRTDLRNLGILFGMLMTENLFPPPPESPGQGAPAELRAAGDDLRSCQQFLIEQAQGLLTAGLPAAHRRARALEGIAAEIGRLADRLAALRPRRAKASERGRSEAPE